MDLNVNEVVTTVLSLFITEQNDKINDKTSNTTVPYKPKLLEYLNSLSCSPTI